MENAKDEDFGLAELIEDQMPGKSCDRNSAHIAEFGVREVANRAGARAPGNMQQGGGYRLLPSFRQSLT
jgi:hypothetical protein